MNYLNFNYCMNSTIKKMLKNGNKTLFNILKNMSKKKIFFTTL
jgi:hypothetical protein